MQSRASTWSEHLHDTASAFLEGALALSRWNQGETFDAIAISKLSGSFTSLSLWTTTHQDDFLWKATQEAYMLLGETYRFIKNIESVKDPISEEIQAVCVFLDSLNEDTDRREPETARKIQCIKSFCFLLGAEFNHYAKSR